MSQNPKSEPKFDALLAELQNAVRVLESGEMPLEESLKTFEKGVGLVQKCQTILKDTEKKIEILTDGNRIEPFTKN